MILKRDHMILKRDHMILKRAHVMLKRAHMTLKKAHTIHVVQQPWWLLMLILKHKMKTTKMTCKKVGRTMKNKIHLMAMLMDKKPSSQKKQKMVDKIHLLQLHYRLHPMPLVVDYILLECIERWSVVD